MWRTTAQSSCIPIIRGGYSEVTEEYYPDTEDTLYLDVTDIATGRISWSFDRQNWYDAYFFTTDFDRAYELA